MSDKTKLWHLENFNLLRPLKMNEMEELSNAAAMRSCSRHQVLYFSEDPSDKIYFLKEGKVKLSRYADDGREIILAMLGPGEIFGELAISGQQVRNETAEATEESIVCILSAAEMERMLEKNPRFNLQVTKFIGLRLQKIESRLASLIFKTSEQRITSFIYESAIEHGKKTQKGIEVSLRLTHEDIAKLTATARQTVSTVFSDLEKRNIINYNRKRILIFDIDLLK